MIVVYIDEIFKYIKIFVKFQNFWIFPNTIQNYNLRFFEIITGTFPYKNDFFTNKKIERIKWIYLNLISQQLLRLHV